QPPLGLTLGSNTGASVTLTGTPVAAGTYDFDVVVGDDNDGIESAHVTLAVTPALQIVTSHLPNGKIGGAYSQVLTASGGGSTDYQWAVTGGALPPGL